MKTTGLIQWKREGGGCWGGSQRSARLGRGPFERQEESPRGPEQENAHGTREAVLQEHHRGLGCRMALNWEET